MQLLSHSLIPGAMFSSDATRDFQEMWQRPEMQRAMVLFGALMVISQVLSVVCYWVASKAVADRVDATLTNGLKLWGSYILFSIIWVGGAFLFLFLLSSTDAIRGTIVAVAWFAIGCVVLFTIPMRIYRIGFWASLGLLLLAGLIQTVAMAAVQIGGKIVPFSAPYFAALEEIAQDHLKNQHRLGSSFLPKMVKEPGEEIDRLLAEAEILTGLSEREAAVRELQARLGERKRALTPGETDANFDRQLERYLRLLNDVKVERGAVDARR